MQSKYYYKHYYEYIDKDISRKIEFPYILSAFAMMQANLFDTQIA